jgi:hypothetical protein
MRSELIFGAMIHVSNRFLLTGLASQGTRKFHRPNTRIQDTINDLFLRFSQSSPIERFNTSHNGQPQLRYAP